MTSYQNGYFTLSQKKLHSQYYLKQHILKMFVLKLFFIKNDFKTIHGNG